MGLFLIGILVCPLGELQEIYLYPSAFIGSTGGEIPLLFLNNEINADWGPVLDWDHQDDRRLQKEQINKWVSPSVQYWADWMFIIQSQCRELGAQDSSWID